MKRRVLFLFIFLVVSNCFGLEIKEEFSAKTQNILDSICYYYNDYLIIDPLDPDSLIFSNDYSLIKLFSRNDGSEVYDHYGYSQEVFFNPADGKIYAYYQKGNDIQNYYGFCIYEKDATLIRELVDYSSMKQIEKSPVLQLWKPYIQYPYSLDFGLDCNFNKSAGYIILTTPDGNVVFNSSTIYGSNYVTSVPAINSKNNKIAFVHLDNDNGIKNYTIKVLSIIYDATCNDTRVRIREEPNLSCNTYGFLNPYDEVKIVDRSDNLFEIDGESWYWYKIESETLPDGWVYGKYLDIEKKLPVPTVSAKPAQEVIPNTPEEAYANIVLTSNNAPYNYWNFENGIYCIDTVMIHTPNEDVCAIQELCKYFLFVKDDYICIYDWETKKTDIFTGCLSQTNLGNSLINYEKLTPETVCIQVNNNHLWTLCARNGFPCLIQRPWIRNDRNKKLFISFSKGYKDSYNIEYNISFPWYCFNFQGYSSFNFTTEPDIISQPGFYDLITPNYSIRSIEELQKWIVKLTDRVVTDEGVFYRGIYEGKIIYIKESELGITYPTLNELLQGIGNIYLGV